MELEIGSRPWRAAVHAWGVRAKSAHIRATSTASFALAFALAFAACSGGGSEGGPSVFKGGKAVVPEAPPRALDDLFAVGDVVAVLDVEAPAFSPFVLRGTVPVPARTFVEPTDTIPFQVRVPGGPLVESQVQTVTRWARTEDGADVVEVLARVDIPAGVSTGQTIRYEVVYAPHARGGIAPTPDVQGLLGGIDTILLRSRDVFGHVYQADLYVDGRNATGSMRVLKQGRVAMQVATHEVLKPVAPVGGPEGTLPHMMGAHAYLTLFTDEDFVELDLRVHTGFSGRDATTTDDDPLATLYFEDLELVVPEGWTAYESIETPWSEAAHPDVGVSVKPIVRKLPGNKLHVMPIMAQFHRRLVIARDSGDVAQRALAHLAQQGQAFCRDAVDGLGRPLCSWWNPDTGRWYAQRHTLPSFGSANENALAGGMGQQLANYKNQIITGATGAWPVESGNLGWAHPWGINDGGMVSGAEIYIYDGADVAQAASRQGYLLTELRHRMYSERQPNVMFNHDGRPARAREWEVHTGNGSYLPVWWYNAPIFWASDPWGYGQASRHQIDAVAAAGRQPSYEAALFGYEPIDWQHLVRYTRNAKTLVWLGNDALAKEDLRMQAEGFLFGYSTLPQDLYNNVIPTGMNAMLRYVALYPNQGIGYGRGESWGLDAVMCAYSTADDAWRESLRPWCASLLLLLEHGQSRCSGIIQSTPQYNVFGGKYRCRQSIEAAIMENALVGLRETVFDEADVPAEARLNEVLRLALYAMISPYVWSEVNNGPWAMIAVGPFDMATAPYCSSIPSDGNYNIADHYQAWSSFAYGYELTHDVRFLERAAEMIPGGDLIGALNADPLSNWQNRAALIQLAQTLTVP